MKFNVTLDRDEDAVWIVECPSSPGCVSQGTTKEEALENIKEAPPQLGETALLVGAGIVIGLPATAAAARISVGAPPRRRRD